MASPSAPPTNVVAVSNSPGSATVSWNAPASMPSGDYYYVVAAKPVNESDPVIGQSLAMNSAATSYMLSGLKVGASYSFSVGIVVPSGGSSEPAVSSVIQV